MSSIYFRLKKKGFHELGRNVWLSPFHNEKGYFRRRPTSSYVMNLDLALV